VNQASIWILSPIHFVSCVLHFSNVALLKLRNINMLWSLRLTLEWL